MSAVITSTSSSFDLVCCRDLTSKLKMVRVLILLIIISNCLVTLRSWDIRVSSPNDVILRHVSLYYFRAFLCVASTTNVTTPTLLESTWPENIIAIKPRPFPSNSFHVGDDEKDCDKIHQARSTDVDGNGFLWILDTGNGHCPAKVIIIDLENKNREVLRSTLVSHDGLKLTSIKINPSTVGTVDHMAYVTIDKRHYLLAFFFHTKSWSDIFVSFGDDPEDQVHPTDIAFTLDNRIYIGDAQGNLFVTNTMNTANSTTMQVNRLGMLLDRPRGFITDEKGHVYYIIQRYGAVVRWNPIRTLNAEGHDVLKFHSGSIIQILFGVHGSVWIALEDMSTKRDHCIRLMFHYTNNAIL